MASITFTLEDGAELEAELLSDAITIGRNPECDIALPSPSVSMHHATIQCRGGSYFVMDHGTTNGTTINEIEIDEAKLEEGDRLYFGDIAARFHQGGAAAAESAAGSPMPEEVTEFAPEEEYQLDMNSAIQPELRPLIRPGMSPGVRPGVRTGMRRGYSTADTSSLAGPLSGLFPILAFILMAFLIGLFIRHYVDHQGRFLLTDVVQVLRERNISATQPAPVKKEE